VKTLQIGDVSLCEKEGGLGRYFAELLRHLPLTGATHHGLVVGATGQTADGSITSFATMDDPISIRMIKARRAALFQMQAHNIELVAAHFAPYGLPLLDRVSKVPLVVHFHGPWAGESSAEVRAGLASKVKATIERLVYSRAQKLIVLSEYFKSELMQRYGVREERVRVIPGGIDAERFNTNMTRLNARVRLDWPTDRYIILSVRRQVKRMGLEELVDAVRILVRRHPQVLLMLAGTGSLSRELDIRVTEYGLQDHIKLLGRVDDAVLPVAYRAADISVVPSRALEGFGLVTLESLASGTPVYVTDVGGLPEVIRPFAPSCIFSDSSASGMAAALATAIENSQDVPSEQECRDYAVRDFGWSSIASRVRAVYDEALA
jgi:glycogen(starch) synthase